MWLAACQDRELRGGKKGGEARPGSPVLQGPLEEGFQKASPFCALEGKCSRAHHAQLSDAGTGDAALSECAMTEMEGSREFKNLAGLLLAGLEEAGGKDCPLVLLVH